MVKIINKSELIAKDIEYQISKKIYLKTIPSERDLAKIYSVSRDTIRQALKYLQNIGIISLNTSKYEINQPKKDYDWFEIFGKNSNLNITNNVLKNKIIEADKKLSLKLEVPLATLIHTLVYKRILKENSITKILSLDYIFFPDNFEIEFSIREIEKYSFWELLSKTKKGMKIKDYQSVSVDLLSDQECKELMVPLKSYILKRTSLIFLDKTPILFISKKIPENNILV
ncbi:GntR family transcriptional regulator [Lactobacillus kullabergensis]|uniref:GntR family transcriptional regulator n=1 Tax=Lactobacillus kullabergensis TaxID=1218493 RepID=UPI0022462364|nr:GntR family transcriptional regulator [Lactobacillus kullabergensis]MCX0292033.1 GntR family transcriptional regulator [Lactobacillus kullabergensis]